MTTPPVTSGNSIDLSFLAKAWPSEIVARHAVGKFSGELLNPRTLANHDAAGTGPLRFRVGRIVCYRVSDLIAWMESRAATPDTGREVD